ncbi:MAG: sarcosine oxidase subunit gamma family protein [Steroidobacteraceae bacterium]
MPAPEAAASEPVAAIALRSCAVDIVEIAPLRAGAAQMQSLIEARGSRLPPVGHVAATADRWVLCVRPGRWLLLESRREPGMSAARWESDCTATATAVDLTSAFRVLDVAGPAAREVLARGCRLDLHPAAFPAGRAARTIMAQVPVILAARSLGVVLLTPATTARHFSEWLAATAGPFGLAPRADLATFDLFGQSPGALEL